MMKRTVCRLVLPLALILLLIVPGVAAIWNYPRFPDPVNSGVIVSLQKFYYGDIVISSIAGPDSVQQSEAVQIAVSTDSAASMSAAIAFRNMTNARYMYYGATSASGLSCNASADKNFFDGGELMNILTTISTATGVSGAKVDFHFVQVDGAVTRVTDGYTADNINALSDGHTSLDYVNSHRWTNWASNTAGVGVSATLNLVAEEDFTLDQIKLYHFVDSGAGTKNNNFRGSCDLPASVEIYYYDDAVRSYVKLTGYTETKNYSSPNRTVNKYGYGVYNITINGNAVTLDASYSGVAPQTTYTLSAPITTSAIEVVLTPQSDYILGLMELQFLNGGSVVTH